MVGRKVAAKSGKVSYPVGRVTTSLEARVSVSSGFGTVFPEAKARGGFDHKSARLSDTEAKVIVHV